MNRATRFVATAVLAIVVACPVTAPAAATISTPTPTPSPTPMPKPPTIREREYWLDDYGIRQAWQTTRGAGVQIAIIDTGIARGNPELDPAVVGGVDMSGAGSADGRTPIGVVDGNHGSWVASLAAARDVTPEKGMIGVAPEAELLSVSLGFGPGAFVPFYQQVADAIVWSVDNGADVINLSFTTNEPDWDKSWDKAFLYAFERDVVIVVAAGNRGSGTARVGAPATIPGVLTVAGVDQNGLPSKSASTQGITIGVAAPSENLLGISADGSLVQWDGTSGAAPIVAGIVALVRSAHPDLDAANVINRLIATADRGRTAASVPDPLYGFGLVDAAGAVSAPVSTVAANPMGDLSEWIRIHRRADPGSEAPNVPAQESAVPVTPLPPPNAKAERPSVLLPSRESLLLGSVPLAVGTVTAILVALGVTATGRRIRLAKQRRA